MAIRQTLSVFVIMLASPWLLASDALDMRLVQKLSGRSESSRAAALSDLESTLPRARAAMPELVAAAQAIAETTNADDLAPPSTIRLLALIGRAGGELSEQSLVELLDAPHAGIAMVAADTLGANKVQGAIEYLKKQTSRREYASCYAFRFNLLRALMKMEHPDAIEFVSQQATALDGQLKYKIDLALAAVDVAHFGGDAERFGDWRQERESAGIFKQASRDPESLARIRFAQQQYYGIEIHAKRLMFILDNSSSMQEYDGGGTRLDRAKAELIRVIEGLPSDSEFALVFYDTTVNAWRDKLVPADVEHKRKAIDFVRRLGYGSKTNTHGALRYALDFDESLEAVFLLTDGRPTAGTVIRPAAIAEDILHRNRFRHLNFNTIGIAVEGSTEQFLKALAAQSDGEYRLAK
jgi:hypothetical protein